MKDKQQEPASPALASAVIVAVSIVITAAWAFPRVSAWLDNAPAVTASK